MEVGRDAAPGGGFTGQPGERSEKGCRPEALEHQAQRLAFVASERRDVRKCANRIAIETARRVHQHVVDLAALVRIRKPERVRVTVLFAQFAAGERARNRVRAEQALCASHDGQAQRFCDAHRVFDAGQGLAVEGEAGGGDGTGRIHGEAGTAVSVMRRDEVRDEVRGGRVLL